MQVFSRCGHRITCGKGAEFSVCWELTARPPAPARTGGALPLVGFTGNRLQGVCVGGLLGALEPGWSFRAAPDGGHHALCLLLQLSPERGHARGSEGSLPPRDSCAPLAAGETRPQPCRASGCCTTAGILWHQQLGSKRFPLQEDGSTSSPWPSCASESPDPLQGRAVSEKLTEAHRGAQTSEQIGGRTGALNAATCTPQPPLPCTPCTFRLRAFAAAAPPTRTALFSHCSVSSGLHHSFSSKTWHGNSSLSF